MVFRNGQCDKLDYNGYKVIKFGFSGSLFDSSAIICLLSSLSYGS